MHLLQGQTGIRLGELREIISCPAGYALTESKQKLAMVITWTLDVPTLPTQDRSTGKKNDVSGSSTVSQVDARDVTSTSFTALPGILLLEPLHRELLCGCVWGNGTSETCPGPRTQNALNSEY